MDKHPQVEVMANTSNVVTKSTMIVVPGHLLKSINLSYFLPHRDHQYMYTYKSVYTIIYPSNRIYMGKARIHPPLQFLTPFQKNKVDMV